MSKLFSSYEVRGVTLKNRIVMSPMCMYSSEDRDGKVNDWHKTHYTSRAVGQVGLIVLEATAVVPEGRISDRDLGIWSDDQIAGLTELVDMVHKQGSRIGIQIAHAGRKSEVDGTIYAPSALPFSEKYKTPEALDAAGIKRTVSAFRDAARRAQQAGFDVIELHGAHGYLINEFLSPLSNKREDAYGGSADNRYRFLSEIIDEVRSVWEGPLFVRVSASDYHPEGLGIGDYVDYSRRMKEQGVDLIDCSSAAVVPAVFDIFPGYQVPFADTIRRDAGIATGAVGLITSPAQAEEIVHNSRADLVFLGRVLLSDPYWPRTAAKELNVPIEAPKQYGRGW